MDSSACPEGHPAAWRGFQHDCPIESGSGTWTAASIGDGDRAPSPPGRRERPCRPRHTARPQAQFRSCIDPGHPRGLQPAQQAQFRSRVAKAVEHLARTSGWASKLRRAGRSRPAISSKPSSRQRHPSVASVRWLGWPASSLTRPLRPPSRMNEAISGH